MSGLAVGLVLASCVLHAFWNLLVKRAGDKLAFNALYLVSAAVLYAPLFLYLIGREPIPRLGWGCVAAASLVYFVYFVGLARAYEGGEFSVVYPMMRGTGPALAFLGGWLFLAERPSAPGACGVALILGSIGMLFWHRDRPNAVWHGRSLGAALAVGGVYGLYSLLDKFSVGRVHLSPPVYLYLIYAITGPLVLAWAVRRRGADAVRAEWRLNARACVAVGILDLFTYLLVLYALALPNAPVGYVIPLRTVSVLFGVLLGARVLGEGRLAAKLGAAALMIGGVLLMALKG